jgi:RNA polymerase sigma factor (sigma-70 family)
LRELLSFGILGRSGEGGKAMRGSTDSGRESELITAILAGNTELYHQLICPYERRVYIMALSYMKNKEDAEDVAQETFVRAMQKLRTFRGDSRFSTWLISIALNEARHGLRRRAAARNVPLDESRDDSTPAAPASLRDWRELPSEVIVLPYKGEGDHPDLWGFGDGKRAFFWIKQGKPDPGSIHWVFMANNKGQVDEFYRAAISAGARDNISPRARVEYYPGYYAADVFDPDGYSFEVVHKS